MDKHVKPVEQDPEDPRFPESWRVAWAFTQIVLERYPRTYPGNPNEPDYMIDPEDLLLGLIDRFEQPKQSQ